ncbi:MAG TPA: hypothetical protein VIR16_03775 [Candidatus Limnocylindrales bacterium]
MRCAEAANSASTPIATTDGGASHDERWGVRLALLAAAPLLFAIVLMGFVGRYGFSPADEGLVEDYAVHMLAGQIPHVDFISPRPIGSSLLHLPTLLAGGPWILEERFIAAVEFAVTSLALAFVALRERPARLGPVLVAVAMAAAAVNLHTFPLMAWYTVDGLLLVAVGYALVLQGLNASSRWRVLVGLFLAGVAATTKQSFLPAILIALALAICARARWTRAGARDLAAAALAAVAAPAAYVLTVAAAGGARALLTQSTNSSTGFLLAPVRSLLQTPMAPVVAVGGLLIVGAMVLQRRPPQGLRRLRALATIAATVGVVGLPLLLPRVLWYGSTYGWAWFWLCAVAGATAWILDRRPDPGLLLVLSVGWMAALSWGAPYPDLVAGSLALVTLIRLWEAAPVPSFDPRAVRAAAAACAVAVLAIIIMVRLVTVYRDHPAPELTADLTPVSPALAGVLTNPVTAEYLEQIQTCVAKYRASRVALLPDGAGAYAALGLRPAMPIDWMWPPDYKGSAPMIANGAARLGRQGDVLVLWQTFDTGRLATMTSLPVATLSSRPFERDRGLGDRLRAAFGPFNDTCGSFLVRYLPAGSR